jgi:hypothetical protein
LLRPREGRDLLLLSKVIHLTPLCQLTCAQGVYGNSVALAHFTGSTDSLVVESLSEADLTSRRALAQRRRKASRCDPIDLVLRRQWRVGGALLRRHKRVDQQRATQTDHSGRQSADQ